jgi:branched-chain amino acid transport system permease protein
VSAIGLNLLTGYAGQASIGSAAFLALGGYTVVLLGPGTPFPIVFLVAIGVSAAVGLAIGLPSLRLRGLYLIFSTLALHFVVSFAVNEYDTQTNALAGHTIAPLDLGFMKVDTDGRWFFVLALVLAFVHWLSSNIVRGRPGRAFAAVRTNEAAAAVMGIDVRRTKLAAFTTSAAITGFAGALGAYFIGLVSAPYYSLPLAISYIAMILIGGLGTRVGPIIGAVIVTAVPFAMQNLSTSLASSTDGTGFLQQNLVSINNAIYGLAILAFLYFRPGGIASVRLPARLFRRGAR